MILTWDGELRLRKSKTTLDLYLQALRHYALKTITLQERSQNGVPWLSLKYLHRLLPNISKCAHHCS